MLRSILCNDPSLEVDVRTEEPMTPVENDPSNVTPVSTRSSTCSSFRACQHWHTVNTMGIRIDDGAVIDGSGLENVEMPAMRNQATISSVKGNELADPNYRAGFLNGATVYLDSSPSG